MRDFQRPGRSPVLATNGMCATSHPLAAQVAVSLLERGGNAVDAAIAGAVLLGICEPAMTGLGGDCFVLLSRDGDDDIIALNGSGRAPAKVDAEKLRADGLTAMPLRGADAVTLPGAISGFCRLSEDHGKLGLADSLAPAIHYAEAGVPVHARAALDWQRDGDALLGPARDHFLNAGRPFREGEIFRAPGQAEVLRRIARQGSDGFYTGEVAEDMVNSLRQAGGVHDLDDLAATRCEYTTPLSGTYRGTGLVEHPPNSQGAIAILIAGILAHFDIASLDPDGAARVHLEAEATKLAYDARDRYVAEPETLDRGAYLTDPALAAELAALIDPRRVLTRIGDRAGAGHKDTVYITVVDRDRMAVSLIYSIYHGFGSGLASARFGIPFQNRGAGFTLRQGHPNELGPGKRPMHTIIPAMLTEDGRATMPFGVMGGQYQPAGHAHVLTSMRDFGMSPQQAIDAPRSFAENGRLKLETGFAEGTAEALRELGHDVFRSDMPIGGGQAIFIHQSGVLEGGSDPRKDGCATGY